MSETKVGTERQKEVEKILAALQKMAVDLGPDIVENLRQDRIVKLAQERKFLLEGLNSEVVQSIGTQKEIYSRRLALVEEELNGRVSAVRKMCQVWQLGYLPFRVNPAWFGGFLEKPSLKRLREYTENVFRDKKPVTVTYRPYSLLQQAIPTAVWEKYQKAKESGIFDVIMIYSPHEEDFTRVKVEVKVLSPPKPTKDPIMVGQIGLNGPVKVDCGYKGRAKIIAGKDKFATFFIDAWDLGKSLKSPQN